MSDDQQQPGGMDLNQGVEIDQLQDGTPLLGHQGNTAILLVRRGEQIYATGAKCTHYSGPLAKGLVVGDTIRCPWHHACFSLKNGEAIGAPALDSIACYAVEQRDGKVFVGARQNVTCPKRANTTTDRIVIVGAGAAGAAAVEELWRQGYQGAPALLGSEAPGPVDRPNLSKDYLAGEAQADWIPLRDTKYYQAHGVDFRPTTAAVYIDVASKRVLLSDGQTLSFDRLLLAPGAEPRRLTIPGAQLPHVYTLRTLADSDAIIARTKQSQRAVVIGAGFIGLEVAASLVTRGLEVHIIAPDALPLAKIMGEAIGRFILDLHQTKGVHFHLQRNAASITTDTVVLDDSTRLTADLVVIGAGVTPRIELAQKAGLTCDNGIIVDEYLQTSVADIYAAGDAARFPEPRSGERARVEHWVHAERMGQNAARNILGLREPFRDPPFFWSQHYDKTISYVGYVHGWDDINIDGDIAHADACILYRKNGKTLAAATLGRDHQGLEIEAEFERGADF